ncbi:Piso0_005748 [Millerozyma farinosa CBS 7064]|uniref:Piso0_005748 protein n=1 Tax=Pichia sorbitophila (strain ATCC MYA-4447 / BCRC 22081 / CBS 7064 / NBRC 10061 / NRRL Y-12695) TaxID=559304 RepID=G8Y2T7_PICSO|nr:Piso0_005748 [Millerozyma farinosa CBS 7064]
MLVRRANLIQQLLRCKNSVLKEVCLACGFSVKSKKEDQVMSIVHGLEIVRKFPRKVNLLAIDMGLKNFSYCIFHGVDITGQKQPVLRTDSWKKYDLHNVFGKHYVPLYGDRDSLMETKRYLSYLSYSVLEDIILKPQFTPHIVVIETQRTRSNSLSATLPNVLLNYTLENMIYSTLYTLQRNNAWLNGMIIAPMTANKMVHFWLKRFLTDNISSSKTKSIRSELFFDWLDNDEGRTPFVHDLKLVENFRSMSNIQKSRQISSALNLAPKDNKIDDLVDSLLYGLTIYKNLQSSHELLKYIEQGKCIETYVAQTTAQHVDLIKNSLSSANINTKKNGSDKSRK